MRCSSRVKPAAPEASAENFWGTKSSQALLAVRWGSAWVDEQKDLTCRGAARQEQLIKTLDELIPQLLRSLFL